MKELTDNTYNRDGHTEPIIMEESKTLDTVEKWLCENTFSEALKKEGAIRYSQSFGNSVEVQVDTRDGNIIHTTEYPNQYGDSDSFFITLASTPEVDIEPCEEFLGDDWRLELTADQIKTIILGGGDDEDFEEFLEYAEVEKEENGKYNISFNDAQSQGVDLEAWFDNLSDTTYEDAVSGYLDWMLEDAGNDWMESVREYYNNLRREY